MDKTKDMIYSEICSVLTDFENGDASAEDLYSMLIDVQNRWEDTITAE
ncbi:MULTISPECIES: hypothetical protein [Bacillus]|nr:MULTISPECIES: hypothetical protein [Bacillus]MDK7626048.1 hypothetical protein [Bacillus licheniformis]MED7755565.1 hypothetical protein [Bacillus licheniformis]TWN76605.1 hypothetical protein CHCC20494_0668 [Bacillus licheniformis]